jgi:predicted RNA-binding Zn-ribbon protein involved in translation (DUF1610 family)
MWQRSKNSNYEKMEEATRAYFPHCPSCATDLSPSYEETANETQLLCPNCGRRWSIIHAQGAFWFLRTNDHQQKKMYTSSWIVHRGDRSLEGIRPYILLETDYSKTGKEKVAEQGLDKFVWKVQPLLTYFDKYDTLTRAHPCERIRLAYACARIKTMRGKERITEPGLGVKQVAAVTNLSEYEASNCTQRLLREGSISYAVMTEEGLTGIEAVIVGFLGEPLYQMDEYTAEEIIRELSE